MVDGLGKVCDFTHFCDSRAKMLQLLQPAACAGEFSQSCKARLRRPLPCDLFSSSPGPYAPWIPTSSAFMTKHSAQCTWFAGISKQAWVLYTYIHAYMYVYSYEKKTVTDTRRREVGVPPSCCHTAKSMHSQDSGCLERPAC